MWLIPISRSGKHNYLEPELLTMVPWDKWQLDLSPITPLLLAIESSILKKLQLSKTDLPTVISSDNTNSGRVGKI